MAIVMAELEYGNLGFRPILVPSVKKRFKEKLAKMEKIEKIRFEILQSIGYSHGNHKKRKAAYPSARAPPPRKINSPCFCREMGL